MNELSALGKMIRSIKLTGLPHECVDCVVTPLLAAAWLNEFNNHKKQRPINARNRFIITEAMKNDAFRKFSDIHFSISGEQVRLINGQHTLTGIVDSGKPIELCVHLYNAPNDAYVEQIYSTFDIGKKRNTKDLTVGLSDDYGLSKHQTESLLVAVKKINSRFKPHCGTDLKLAYDEQDMSFLRKQMDRWVDSAAYDYFGSISGASKENTKLFMRSDVVAVGLITCAADPLFAMPFWHDTAFDDGLRTGDPKKTLLAWLRANTTSSKNAEQYRAVISCWNSAKKGKSLTKVSTDSNASLKISGCDFECDGYKE